MKLQNKKTGEIKELTVISEKFYLDDIGFARGESFKYNSLAELNEEWEDYEEPKDFWFIGEDCCPHRETFEVTKDFVDRLKEIGNYFETKEEAEKAVERLKAWKRLKEKGFEFKTWGWEKHSGKDFTIWFTIDDYVSSTKDLDLLFGGEE